MGDETVKQSGLSFQQAVEEGPASHHIESIFVDDDESNAIHTSFRDRYLSWHGRWKHIETRRQVFVRENPANIINGHILDWKALRQPPTN
mmetsp:Transcript_2415/g.6944  ORF Transcript_2415/g.6944 Transcript_2415/m.6944 type:complete len:90 (-) Transcript_2415:803-1072(-)